MDRKPRLLNVRSKPPKTETNTTSRLRDLDWSVLEELDTYITLCDKRRPSMRHCHMRKHGRSRQSPFQIPQERVRLRWPITRRTLLESHKLWSTLGWVFISPARCGTFGLISITTEFKPGYEKVHHELDSRSIDTSCTHLLITTFTVLINAFGARAIWMYY